MLRGGCEIWLTSPATNTWASLGKCHDSCVQQYAFAIVQGSTCWCSNYAPGSTVATTDCNAPCPGYPYEFCGAEDSGLFGYLALNKPPSGTMSASAPSSPSSAAAVSPRCFLRYVSYSCSSCCAPLLSLFIPDSIRSRPRLRPPPCWPRLRSNLLRRPARRAQPYGLPLSLTRTSETIAEARVVRWLHILLFCQSCPETWANRCRPRVVV